MAVDSGTVSNLSVARKKERVKSPLKKNGSQPEENAVPSSPAKRNNSPRIRIVGGRIYDSVNGKSCHQCRQKTRDFVAACKNQRNNKPCAIMYCHKCLLNRYGEEAMEVDVAEEWSCPKCRGICNCSICMKKRGHQPTGMLITTAKATGFSSVSEMLIKGAENLNNEKVITDKNASPKKEVVPSPRKRGKENSIDEKVDLNVPNHVNKKLKKVKEKKVHKGNLDNNASPKIISQTPDKRKLKLEETGSQVPEKKPKKSKDDVKDDVSKLARRTSPRKSNVSNKMPNQGTKKVDNGVDPNENKKDIVVLTKDDFVLALENGNRKQDKRNTTNDNADIQAEIPLPMGIELDKVAGVDVRTEDIGNAMQFLEFCSVFGKILDVKKGQPELVLKDLLHGRTGRRGKFSLTVQFHIHLLSILKEEQGEESTTLSPSNGKSSWFRAFKECLSESKSVLKAQGLDSLDTAADYESLDASEKLRLLNILCDEILETEKVRNWMDDQNTELAEKIKEAKREVLAAKDKEKSLKQKMKDDITKAMISGHGALTISEHEAIISRIKREAAQAHTEMLESQGIFLKSNRTSDATRIEPIFVGRGGHVYWKLNGSCKTDVLHQLIDTGKEDAPKLGEKWFALDNEGKEAIEKHICSLRVK
ncbi:hypothetical protein ABFS82_12G033200 [Erythranthe guttata]